MFSDEEILDLKRYTQTIINSPRPIMDQPLFAQTEDGKRWCQDWEIIEICKYIFNGAGEYAKDPPPNRLKNNPLWSKDGIVRQAEELIHNAGGMSNLIQQFKMLRIT